MALKRKACEGIIRLESNRVYRPFIGGKSIDEWENKKEAKDNHYGERWVASIVHARNPGGDMDEGLSRVKGEAAETLLALIHRYPSEMLGEAHLRDYGIDMGMLVKVIDAYSRLLIQVHPDKKKAMTLFQSPYGKTEAWYIVSTRVINGVEPYILLGFKEGVTKAWYEAKFHEQDINALEECMHKIDVKPGDVYIIPGGLTHALGSGCMLVEIQEPTDFTIRSEKKSASGVLLDDNLIHQGLGYERMFECYDFSSHTEEALIATYKLSAKVQYDEGGNSKTSLVENDYFTMRHINIVSQVTHSREASFEIILILKGNGTIRYGDIDFPVEQGDEFFVPNTVDEISIIRGDTDNLELICCLPPKTKANSQLS